LHIAKREKDVPQLLEDLNKIASIESESVNIPIEAIVREGSIFTEIGEVAKEINAFLVVMGTHGIRGMQKLTGSWALKVIANSDVPFYVVQEAPEKDEINKVVVPIDFMIENKQKLTWVYELSKFFRLEAHLFVRKSGYSQTDNIRIKGNLNYAKKYLSEKGINYVIAMAEGKEDFWKETVDYAEKIDADMIMTMTTKDITALDYVFGADEQKIIANDSKIPVMAVNPAFMSMYNPSSILMMLMESGLV
jgi:nucleotide-binding universal stress UspA family protein